MTGPERIMGVDLGRAATHGRIREEQPMSDTITLKAHSRTLGVRVAPELLADFARPDEAVGRERAAFLVAVDAAPCDTAPRLMFADWLDEHAEPLAAEWLRLDVWLDSRRPPWCGKRQRRRLMRRLDALERHRPGDVRALSFGSLRRPGPEDAGRAARLRDWFRALVFAEWPAHAAESQQS